MKQKEKKKTTKNPEIPLTFSHFGERTERTD